MAPRPCPSPGGAERYAFTLEVPPLFKSFADFEALTLSYRMFVTNHLRKLPPDAYLRFSELTHEQQVVQAALTGCRELAYIGEGPGPGQPVSHRTPISDEGWQRVLTRSGLQGVRILCDRFLQLLSSEG